MRFDRRKTYPGLGDNNNESQRTERLSTFGIIPERVGGVIKSRGVDLIPMNRIIGPMGPARWRMAASRMDSGGTSPFFGSVYIPIGANVIEGHVNLPNPDEVIATFDRDTLDPLAINWEFKIDGVVTALDDINHIGDDRRSIVFRFAADILSGQVVTFSNILPGDGVALFRNKPVLNAL